MNFRLTVFIRVATRVVEANAPLKAHVILKMLDIMCVKYGVTKTVKIRKKDFTNHLRLMTIISRKTEKEIRAVGRSI